MLLPANKENTMDLSQSSVSRKSKIREVLSKGTRIFIKGIGQRRIQHRIGAKVDRVPGFS